MPYFLGVDVGSSKTHALLADEQGQVVGFGQSGAGNHETVGYDGLSRAVQQAAGRALAAAGIGKEQVAGAGFGVAGFDWPVEKEATLAAVATLELNAPVAAVNDALIGLLAGAEAGWGIAVVSGTGCNCRGWDAARQREGMVTGGSHYMGEGAGASELVIRAIQAVAHAWTGRGPATKLVPAFLQHTGAADLPDLLFGLTEARFSLPPEVAPLVFEVAASGDQVALEVIQWAGRELGELAKAVIRQLEFERLSFEVVMVGSLFKGGDLLIRPLQETVWTIAPQARFVPLTAPPVTGAVLLAMEQAGLRPETAVRHKLAKTAATFTQ